ncbi:hypothetical protein TSAR_014493, partial [Trichomalopsis sarcophagae]
PKHQPKIRMKFLLSLSFLALAAVSHAQFIYPDEFETLREEEARRQSTAGGLHLPMFEPTVQSINDVESAPYYPPPLAQSGFQQQDQPDSRPPAASPPVGVKRPTSNPFDTFLPPRWRDHVINIISRGVTKFTLDMDHAIEKSSPANSRENLLFSPVSLTLTLAMVMLASNGKTFEEVTKILGLESGVDISHHSEIVHQIFGLLIQQSEQMQLLDPTAPQCKLAFGIFVEDGYPVREQFKAVSEKVYKSEVISVDFSHHNRQAQSVINDWVSNKTNHKIKNMLYEPPSPLTDVIITSALYFSGEWEQHFMEGSTKRKPFTIENGETVYVDMMYNGGYFPFYEDKQLGVKIIGFPYKGHEVTMYAILPNNPGAAALREMKHRLTPEIIENLIANMKNSSCILSYPKMKLSSTLKLQSALEALGLSSLFNPYTADLSVLSPGRAGFNRTQPPPPPSTPSRTPTTGFNGGFRQPTKTLHSDFTFEPRFQGARNNMYRYEDRTGGYRVEQWDTGYNLHKIRDNRRAKRQSRPIDQEFVDFLNSQKLPTFGVDELRNSAGISNPGLYADDVIHKVEMTVNEKGTEAAAATSVILDRSGDYKRFIANRPFVFFIRHDLAKAIWFWGTMNRPTPFYETP